VRQGNVYWACTNGGGKQFGQIWRYRPSPAEGRTPEDQSPGELELLFEPNHNRILQNADNLIVAPWGDLIVCEDREERDHLVGITPEGGFYRLARNALNHSELTGSTFSADGTTLFGNIQDPGMTLAITGNWPTVQSEDGLGELRTEPREITFAPGDNFCSDDLRFFVRMML
jgi:hypothetical protein